MRKWSVTVCIPKGNGKEEILQDEIEGSERDAEICAWGLLESAGITSSWIESEDSHER